MSEKKGVPLWKNWNRKNAMVNKNRKLERAFFFLLLEIIEKREHEESTQRGYP